jgi:hypothetical protein
MDYFAQHLTGLDIKAVRLQILVSTPVDKSNRPGWQHALYRHLSGWFFEKGIQ